VRWILCCDQGYSSSLAAASLQTLGLSSATDVIGGFQAWRAAGLPVAPPGQPSRPRLPCRFLTGPAAPSTRPAPHGPRQRLYRPPEAPLGPRRAGKSVRIG